jgi:mono/diheme cytochrome c family protein
MAREAIVGRLQPGHMSGAFMRTNACFSIGLFLAAAAIECFAQAPPAQQCPQPRFTGKAPEPYYSQKNPLPAGRDLGGAARLFRGEAQGQLGCAPCHGLTGGGDGKLSGQFDPRPRNFRCAVTINDVADGQLFWVIRFGSPGTSMPPHRKFTDEQIWELVSYLRTLAQ